MERTELLKNGLHPTWGLLQLCRGHVAYGRLQSCCFLFLLSLSEILEIPFLVPIRRFEVYTSWLKLFSASAVTWYLCWSGKVFSQKIHLLLFPVIISKLQVFVCCSLFLMLGLKAQGFLNARQALYRWALTIALLLFLNWNIKAWKEKVDNSK